MYCHSTLSSRITCDSRERVQQDKRPRAQLRQRLVRLQVTQHDTLVGVTANRLRRGSRLPAWHVSTCVAPSHCCSLAEVEFAVVGRVRLGLRCLAPVFASLPPVIRLIGFAIYCTLSIQAGEVLQRAWHELLDAPFGSKCGLLGDLFLGRELWRRYVWITNFVCCWGRLSLSRSNAGRLGEWFGTNAPVEGLYGFSSSRRRPVMWDLV